MVIVQFFCLFQILEGFLFVAHAKEKWIIL
jgi:hypothetical protein